MARHIETMSTRQALAIARMYVKMHAGIVTRQRGHKDVIAVELATAERLLKDLVNRAKDGDKVTL